MHSEGISINSTNSTNKTTAFRDLVGKEKSREEVLEKLRQDPVVYQDFLKLTPELREELVSFAMGVRGAKMTYDPFFKAIFNPEQTPERLEAFLSLCLGEPVTILKVMPNDSSRLTAEGSFLVMDILVCFESGALANVEIQRMGYLFPGQRCACYSSDLVMRQYSQVRSEKNDRKEEFSYQDIQKVYTIVLIQQSIAEFHRFPDHYLHYAKQSFDTGLELDLLQEYLIIPLDIFLENLHNKGIQREIDGWLTFIAAEDLKDIYRLLEVRPEFEKLYREVFAFRDEMRGLIGMYSEALRILDANTAKYMVELQRQKIEEQAKQLEAKETQLEKQNSKLMEQQKKLEALQNELEQLKAAPNNTN